MTISIIIPTRNEGDTISQQLEYLSELPREPNTGLQLIVCDGESEDDTVVRARSWGAHVVESAANRGLQQNRGAQVSIGELLWFLHADARPHPRSLLFLQELSRRPHISGGNFRLCFGASGNASTLAARSFERIAQLQRKRGIYYGDSGIWVRRDLFELLGGFRDWPLFEDYDFARRLEGFSRRNGMRTVCAKLPINVSARRIENRGVKVLLQWLALQVLFSLGTPPERLARRYYSHRDDEQPADAISADMKFNRK